MCLKITSFFLLKDNVYAIEKVTQTIPIIIFPIVIYYIDITF